MLTKCPLEMSWKERECNVLMARPPWTDFASRTGGRLGLLGASRSIVVVGFFFTPCPFLPPLRFYSGGHPVTRNITI